MSDMDKDLAFTALLSGAAMVLVLTGALWWASGILALVKGSPKAG